MCPKSENPHFHVYFLNMDISLIINHICLKICMRRPIVEICLEGRVSKNVDKGISFCFMVCRRRDFEKKKSQKLPVFSYKTKQTKKTSQKLPVFSYKAKTRA